MSLALLALDASPYEGNFTYELNELKLATLAFDIKRFEAVMDHCIERYGVHKRIEKSLAITSKN